MKFTIVATVFALAAASGVAAQSSQSAVRNIARSLIVEYDQFLESRKDGCVARNPSKYQGMECDIFSCNTYCVPGDKKCKWSSQPAQCKKCKCQKE